jgi:HK97 family phage prohead protease
MRKQRGRGPMEYKTFPFIEAKVDDDGVFEGFAAVTGNVDLQRDIIEPGAFTKTLQETPIVPVLWQHDPTKPIGVSLTMSEVQAPESVRRAGAKTALQVRGQLALGVQQAREARELVQLGAVKGLSIGYYAIKPSFPGDGTRRLKEVDVEEFSFATFQANRLATIDNMKALTMDRKYYGLYDEDTEEVGCLLTAIASLTQFASQEAAEGEADDLAAAQSILGALASLLASELSEFGADDDADDASLGMAARVATYFTKEGRVLSTSNRKLVTQARDALQALLDGSEPAKATRAQDGAATKQITEPGDHSDDVIGAELAAIRAALARA